MGNDTKHTAGTMRYEPGHTNGDFNPELHVGCLMVGDWIIADVCEGTEDAACNPTDESNARRLAACWNLFHDIPEISTELIVFLSLIDRPLLRMAMLKEMFEHFGEAAIAKLYDAEGDAGVDAAIKDVRDYAAKFIAKLAATSPDPREHLDDHVAQPHPAASTVPD